MKVKKPRRKATIKVLDYFKEHALDIDKELVTVRGNQARKLSTKRKRFQSEHPPNNYRNG